LADALATLLVQEGAVTLEALARAQAQQRAQGGSLDTALLELRLLGERPLLAALARASGLPPAPPAALDEPDPRSRRVFPAKVAERHGLAPFRLEGKELHLLATWPVDVAALDEISFMLSLHLVPHVAPEWRVWELRRRVYDAALPERFRSLAARLREEEARAPEPAEQEPAPEPAEASAPPSPAPPGPEGQQPRRPAPAGAVPPLAEEGALAGVALDEAVAAAPSPSAPIAPLARALAEAVELAEAEVEAAPLPPAPAGPAEAWHRPARWTLAEARQALSSAASRDEAVTALLRYALGFFEHAALLATSRGELHGHDALGGDPKARARARAVVLPCGDAGIVRAVVETGGPYLGPPGPDPVVDGLLQGLGRGPPRTMLLYPVQIRDRVVCLLYGDNGEAPVSPGRVGDLLLLASEVGAALLRILAARKVAGVEAPARPEPVAPEAPAAAEPTELSWEALAPVPTAAAGLPPLRLDLLPASAPGAPEPLPPPELLAPPEPLAEPGPLAPPDPLAAPELRPPPAAISEPGRLSAPEPLAEPGPMALAVPAEPLRSDGPPVPAEPLVAQPLPEPTLAERVEPPDGEVTGAVDGSAVAEAQPGPGPEPEVALPTLDPREAFTPPPAFDPVIAVKQLTTTRRGSAARARLLAQLALHGPESAAALAEALPGPVTARDPGGEEALPLAERGPVLEALCALDIVATPWLVAVLSDPDPRRRRYAAMVLGQVGDPAAFLALSDRIFDADPGVSEAAMAALSGLRGHPDFRPVLERLRRALHGEAPRPAFAARALVELGDGGAVGPLIALLEGAPGTVAAAEEALEALTARRLGRDPSAWSAWWQAHRGQRRSDWLFEALADGDREVRIAAAEALRTLGPSPVRFFADAPEPERRRSAGEWREWLESHGLEA